MNETDWLDHRDQRGEDRIPHHRRRAHAFGALLEHLDPKKPPRDLRAHGRFLDVEADVVAEIQARLGVSLVLAPEGRIPMHEEAGHL